MIHLKITVLLVICCSIATAQHTLHGKINFKSDAKVACVVGIRGTSHILQSDSLGTFRWTNFPASPAVLTCSCPSYQSVAIPLHLTADTTLTFELLPLSEILDEISVIGQQKTVTRSESPIVTDVFDKKHFEKNTASSFFDVMDRVNGVRAQVNCNVCGTGDIHINGLEGAYTLIVVDGIPIVGGLSSVYGLSGIPAFLIDRIEISKGPASSIYGSESVAGIIHVYTKKATKQPAINLQHFLTSHGETTTDLGISMQIGKRTSVLTAGNYTYNALKIDHNADNFTDIPLQNRFSIFQKWQIARKENRIFSVSGRMLREQRWGGELNWNPNLIGSDSVYAESIKTERDELNVVYQLPTKEKLLLTTHFNRHFQNSFYGEMPFKATQNLIFGQLTWEKTVHKNHFLTGITARQTFYNDNSVITADTAGIDQPIHTFLPGLFVQHTATSHPKHQLTSSVRLDYHPVHAFIFTPRVAYRYVLNKHQSLRINAGKGFRVVNLFSEDHASLSGARQIEILESLKPEKSASVLIAHSLQKSWKNALFMELNTSLFYTHFNNRIVADYDTDPTKISYKNLDGYAVSRGISVELKVQLNRQLNVDLGTTLMEVNLIEQNQKAQQILTEKFSGNWTVSYSFLRIPLTIDYTGNLIGPMRLPLAGSLDPRPANSATYSIQNVQVTYTISKHIAVFGGVKNLLNWTPAKGIPFLIAQANDPFGKEIVLNPNGQVQPTVSNPFGLQFDPSYVYAANQGIRFFFGFRVQLVAKN